VQQAQPFVLARMPGGDMIRGLTVRNPWAWAIAHGGKNVESRGWHTNYRGWIAVHAAARLDTDKDVFERVAKLSGRPEAQVREGSQVRGAVIAVARLSYVCTRTTTGFDTCACGPWAVPGHLHLHLTDRLALPEPVPCKGLLTLWKVPPETISAIRDQWRAAAANPKESS
jgi:hypothetical protein